MSNWLYGRPGFELLQAIYQQLPVMVVVLASDGQVLYCNPAASRITGFQESELVGKNLWATLFPGRLFAQVPKFISAIHPAEILGNDVAMVIRTKEGRERVVAWSRILPTGTADGQEAGVVGGVGADGVMVCFGTDLTDRLDAADLAANAAANAAASEVTAGPRPAEGFGLGVGNAGTVDGEMVTPIAISPPVLPGDAALSGGAAVQQVHEFLTGIDERIDALESAFAMGELERLAGIASSLQNGAHACGLLEFSTRAEKLYAAASRGALEQVSCLVHQIVTMVRAEGG